MKINKLQINSNESFGAQTLWGKWEMKRWAQLIKRLLLGAEFCVTLSKEEVFPSLPSGFDLLCSRLSKSPSFFPGWLCNFKALFIPVWRLIHRAKIVLVTSWQLTNRTVSDISRRSRHSIMSIIFPAWIYNMIQIYLNETSREVDL